MNKLLLALIIIAVAGIAVALLTSCKVKSKALKKNDPKPNPEVIVKGIGDTLAGFRFESYPSKEWVESDVYDLTHNKYGSYLYFRKGGSNIGWGQGFFDAEFIYPEFEKLINELNLASYPYTPLDNEDKKRSRWNLRIKYSDRHSLSIVKYLNPEDLDKDNEVMEKIRGLFSQLLNEMEARQVKCESSRHTYDSNGKLRRRIDYTSDGIVHGGWDSDDPLATF